MRPFRQLQDDQVVAHLASLVKVPRISISARKLTVFTDTLHDYIQYLNANSKTENLKLCNIRFLPHSFHSLFTNHAPIGQYIVCVTESDIKDLRI
jgi:hypothetical protein